MTDKNKYISYQGDLSPNQKIDYPTLCYYDSEYLNVQSYQVIEKKYLINQEKNKVVGICILSVDQNQRKVSLPKAPFGSLYVNESIESDQIKSWLNKIIQPSLILRHYPPIYGKKVNHLLEKSSFKRLIRDLNHHIELKNFNLSMLHDMQKRRIQKCLKAGFRLEKITSVEEVIQTHSYLSACRVEQGLTINITQKKLLLLFNKLPLNYHIFQVLNPKNEIMAATIVVKATENIIYNYLPGNLKSSNSYSPMAFLIFQMAKYYQDRSFQYLDLGVSSINGIEQITLALFKERMGAKKSFKDTYYF